MAEQGTVDVSKDLQERTDLKPMDQVLLINAETKELQQLSMESLEGAVRIAPARAEDVFG